MREASCGVEDIVLGEAGGGAGSVDGGGRFGGRKLQDETRTDRRIVFDAEQTVVFGNNARCDGKAKAGAAVFRREMREEESVLVGGRDAVAGVFDADFDRVGFGVKAREDVYVSNGGGFEGFGGVVYEIDDDAAEEAGVGTNGGNIFAEVAGEDNAVEAAGENFERFADDVVGAGGFEFCRREADELRELVDEGG